MEFEINIMVFLTYNYINFLPAKLLVKSREKVVLAKRASDFQDLLVLHEDRLVVLIIYWNINNDGLTKDNNNNNV